MHKTAAETAAFFDAFLRWPRRFPPKRPDLRRAAIHRRSRSAADTMKGTRVALGAQTMHWELKGAYTGEDQRTDAAGVRRTHVILGHSERRAYCDETDRTVNLKVKTALEHGLTPIVAVGETLEERDAVRTNERVVAQMRAAFAGVALRRFAPRDRRIRADLGDRHRQELPAR